MCMVTPIALKSLTLKTLLITSLPRSSNTRTFHTGSPSLLTTDALGATKPPAEPACSSESLGSKSWFRLSILRRDARGITNDVRIPYTDSQLAGAKGSHTAPTTGATDLSDGLAARGCQTLQYCWLFATPLLICCCDMNCGQIVVQVFRS